MTPVGDDELREMLESRADRHSIDLHAVVEVARCDAIGSGRGSRRPWRFGAVVAGLGSVVALALALVVVVVPLSLRSTASAGPSALAAPTVSAAATAPPVSPPGTGPVPSPSWAPGWAPAQALSAQGLTDWLTTAGATAKGRVVVLEGELIPDPSVSCFANAPDCPPTIVRKAPDIVVEPVGDVGPGPWDGSGSLVGMFALRGTDRTWSGTSPVMELLGVVRKVSARSCGRSADCHGRLAWLVQDFAGTGPTPGPDLFLVAGWMVRTPLHPCASPASNYGCPSDDLLTPDRVQPTRPDGSSELPETALRLPSGTYDEFAPDPAPDGHGVVPRLGNFLLQRVIVPPCGPTLAGCDVTSAERQWVVRARVDPIEGAASPS